LPLEINDDLADVARAGHQAERVADLGRREHLYRKLSNQPLREQVHDLGEDLPEHLRPLTDQPVEIDGGKEAVLVEATHVEGIVLLDVPLSDFDETSIRSQDITAPAQCFTRKTV
jgi:hypothetical protein